MRVLKYGRFWAVRDGDDLVCVAVYKKGAQEVVRRLTIKGGNDDEGSEVKAGNHQGSGSKVTGNVRDGSDERRKRGKGDYARTW